MVNEEKVKLMCRLSIYEEQNGKKQIPLSTYYKSDYVKYNGIKTLVAVSIGFLLVVAGFCLANLEQLLEDLNSLDYYGLIAKLVAGYLLVVAVYYIISRIIYGRKYEKAKSDMRVYQKDLRKLNSFYQGDPVTSPKILHKRGETPDNDEFIDF